MEFSVYDIAIVPVIVALVGVFGKLGLGPRLQPVAALIFGLAAGIFYVAPEDPRKAVFVGIVIGISAIGAYSGVKNTIERRQDAAKPDGEMQTHCVHGRPIEMFCDVCHRLTGKIGPTGKIMPGE